MTLWQTLHTGAAIAALAAAPALAQEAAVAAPPVPPIPDIIVTAEHRADPAQQVPIALTVLTGDMLSARSLATPLAVAGMVPNMFASSAIGAASANDYTLRGLGQGATDPNFSPAVGTFVDDIYLSPVAGTNFQFFDIGRIAVLRGPQGTLYGRNTSAGAVTVAIDRPSDVLGGYGEFAYGAFNRLAGRASLNLPLSTGVALKLSGYFQDDRGYVHNTTTGERLNDSDAAGIRGALQLKLTDTLRWNLAGTYMRNDGDNLANSVCDPNAPTRCDARFAATGRLVRPPLLATTPLLPLGNRLDTQLYTSHIDWASDAIAISAITGFVTSRQRLAIDLTDGRAMPNAAVPFPVVNPVATGVTPVTRVGRHNQFSQELRLTGSLLDGRVDYIAGLLYLDSSDTSDLGYAIVDNGVIDKAGYLQVDINATDRIKLTGGVRYTDEETTFAITDARASCQPAAACFDTANLVGGPTTRKTKQWTPRFVASWRATDAVMAYASASRGFRSGGRDARVPQVAGILPFAPETSWSYEGGIKADAFGGRVRANLAAFWMVTRNAQAPLLTGGVPVAQFAGVPVLQNIPGYRNRGVELEVTAVPVTGLNLRASIGYQNARYTTDGATAVAQQQQLCRGELAAGKVPLAPPAGTLISVPGPGPGGRVPVIAFPAAGNCAAGIIDANGDVATPARTPDVTLGLGGAYDWAIPAAGIILTPSVDARYIGAFEAGTANATLFTGSVASPLGGSYPANPFGGDVITGSRNAAVWQVAAALTLRTDDNNWTLALECANCLDTAYTQSVAGTVRYLNPPRTWQVRARRVF
ncbi:TonB-dependent receptor [Polymorphobacter fuscus]|uniref:TonB-dependent receptor n=1 Tax=Sandarakinorhabdus fusca TaxID=1439888 RepID=A0A7C9GR39_9SPHN|nr:TonB-dependent receptor [Polymorphobacter fuscus]KAB7644946.1 TonB-dependent receptor [Polymorphobacter fuscus]MQT18233.1 TonB-dependent receptor [Polymorphobacter fuscus]NJC09557.1 iron complex outermembrane receptor protein [Polymorphobacter fuscus]